MVNKKRKFVTKHTDDTPNTEPGMVVEATKGDLGEADVSKPKVTEVVQDEQGNVDKLVVQKGVIFRKTLEIAANRIQTIDQEDSEVESTSGKVVVDVSKKEAASLTSTGVEALETEQQHDLLDKVEQEIPTAGGLRELEAMKKRVKEEQASVQPVRDDTTNPSEAKLHHSSRSHEGLHTVPDKKTISSCMYSVQDS